MSRLLMILLIAGSVQAQDKGALAIVKASIEAHGGAEALGKARTATSSASGTMTNRGQEIKFAATGLYGLPEKYRIEMTAELNGMKLVVTQVLNGKKTKVSAKLNGVENPLDPKVKDETVQAGLLQDVSTLVPLVEGKKYSLRQDKDADVNGSPAAVVIVTGNGLREVKLFFDKKTQRLVKTQRKAFANGAAGVAEVDEETYMSDFKAFDKAQLPTTVLVNHDGKKFMTMTVSDWKFLAKVDEKEFVVD